MKHHRDDLTGGRQTGGGDLRRSRRRVWSCRPLVGWLELRTLLAGPSDLAAGAVALPLDSPLVATIAPQAAMYYRVSSDSGGKLMAVLHAPGFAAELSLVDADGLPLVQSDGSATAVASDGALDVNVPAGDDFLEVRVFPERGSFSDHRRLDPHRSRISDGPEPFCRFRADRGGPASSAINAPVDLVAPDGIHVGNGDGTFQSHGRRRPARRRRAGP